ncbi:MAG TPA: hypothetical protein VFO34_00865 [Candidatus Acidoferrales bacterium]|nr:hypothetical protein [Candidatus Acidoferrales bacterium]
MTIVSSVSSGPRFPRPQFWVFLLLVLGASAWYEGHYLYRGWVPHDEGCLTESALRVMHGQLPHRDYIEIYTGGLAYLDALAFRLLGLRFVSMRIVLFAFFLLWVIAVYWIATNMVSEWIAASVTFFAVLWSLPNYSAAMPSWYNLFFATFGIAALFQFIRARSKKWLFIAGSCAGLSFLIKIAGLYFLAAVLLYCMYHEQEMAAAQNAEPSKHRGAAYTIFVIASLVIFTAIVFRMIFPGAYSGEYLHFLLPVTGICAYLMHRELLVSGEKPSIRFRRLAGFLTPAVAGFFIPVGTFLIPYLRSHSVHSLLNGLFVLPYLRVASASIHALPLLALPFAFIVSGPLALAFIETGPMRSILSFAGILIVGMLVAFSFSNVLAYRLVWNTIAWTIPILALFALSRLWKASNAPPESAAAQERLFMVTCAAVMCGLIQFPFAVPTYFCYVSPIAILGVVALTVTITNEPRFFLAATMILYTIFGVLAFTPGFLEHMGTQYVPDRNTASVDAPIARGLRVYPESAATYNRIEALIREHATGGMILAGPDSPQFYVMSGFTNPMESPFEFFEPLNSFESTIQALVKSGRLRMIIIADRPQFSRQYIFAIRAAVDASFVGHEFVEHYDVYWRP